MTKRIDKTQDGTPGRRFKASDGRIYSCRNRPSGLSFIYQLGDDSEKLVLAYHSSLERETLELLVEAWVDGNASGYGDGYDDGYKEGYNDGFADADENVSLPTEYEQVIREGYMLGVADASYDVGFMDGQKKGYEKGRQETLTDAQDLGDLRSPKSEEADAESVSIDDVKKEDRDNAQDYR